MGRRPRTTVGFAGPGKSIAGGKRRYISGVATDGRSMLRLLYYCNIRTGGGRRVGGGEQSGVGAAATRAGRCTEEMITHTHTHTCTNVRRAPIERERFLCIVPARTPVVEVQVRRPRESSAAEVRAKI